MPRRRRTVPFRSARRSRRSVPALVFAAVLLAGGLPGSLPDADAADHGDGVLLDLNEGALAGDLDLSWSGGVPEFAVYQSPSPVNLLDPANRVATTAAQSITLPTDPAETLLFFEVTSGSPWAVEWFHTTGDPLLAGEQEHPCDTCGEAPGAAGDASRIGPVMLHSGEVVLPVMLPAGAIPGKGAEDWNMPLVYRSQIEFFSCVGAGWNLHYLTDRLRMTTTSAPAGAAATRLVPAVRRYVARGARYDDFSGAFPGDRMEARGFFQAAEFDPTGTIVTFRNRHGFETTYHGFNGMSTDGALQRMEDRNGNFLEFLRDPSGRLASVVDPMGREIRYRYDPVTDMLQAIEDFAGRVTTFTQDAACHELREITTPPISGTPNADDGIPFNGSAGNDFPAGTTWKFRYDCGNPDPRLRHNLLGVTFPNETATGGPERISFVYGSDPADPLSYDRVVELTIGGGASLDPVTGLSLGVGAGGTWTFSYQDLAPRNPGVDLTTAVRKTTVTDPNGNRTEYLFNSDFHEIERTVHTNRNVNPGDPSTFVTRREWNADSLVERILLPEGNAVEFDYDGTNPNRFSQGNLLRRRSIADPARGGDQQERITTYTYEPIYNMRRTVTTPRGDDPIYVPPIADDASLVRPLDLNLDGDDADPTDGETTRRLRYTWWNRFDYQEGTDADIQSLAGSEWVDLDLDGAGPLSGADIALALSIGGGLPVDLNGDGTTAQQAGNAIEVRAPVVHLPSGGGQEIVETRTYNDFGQVTSIADPEGNLVTRYYHPESDPDGNGISEGLVRSGVDPDTGGYLRMTVRDDDPAMAASPASDPLRPGSQPITNAGTSRRTRTAPPVVARRLYEYDAVGNLTSHVEPRGIRTDLSVNAHNRVNQTTAAAAVGVFPADPVEPGPLVAFRYLTRYEYDFNGNLIRRQVEDRGDTSGVGANNAASGTAFVDTEYRYDLLDRPIEVREEVDPSGVRTTRYRYDPNGNPVLVIQPEGNAVSAVHDERDLLFTATTGATGPPALAHLAPSDPTHYDVRGGTEATTSRLYDANGNLILYGDAGDTDGSTANNETISVGGDRTIRMYDGHDRPGADIDAVGLTKGAQYDPDGNVVRVLRFGPSGGPSPTANGPFPPLRPFSSLGVVQAANLVNPNLLSGEEIYTDEYGRSYQTGRLLFYNGPATVRPVDVADGAASLGKGNLTPGDTAAVPGLSTPAILGRVSNRIDYDRNGAPRFHREDDADTTEFNYDGLDRVVKATDAEGNSIEYAYDDAGNVIEIREIDQAQVPAIPAETFLTTFYYDSLGRLERSVDNLGHSNDFRYDSRGNPVATADPNGPVAGTVSRRVFPPGPSTVNAVNGFGNVSLHAYDALGRRVESERILTASGTGDGVHIGADVFGVKGTPPAPDPSQADDGRIKVKFTWDRNDLLLDTTDDLGNRTRFAYDNLNRRTSATRGICVAPMRADRCDTPTMEEFQYDRDHNLTLHFDEIGNVVSRSHDAINRPVSLAVSRAPGVDGTTAQSYEYDGLSRLTATTDDNHPASTADDSEVRRAYDSLDRLVEEIQQTGPFTAKVLSSGWRAEDLRSSLAYPNDRTVEFRYDLLDREVSVLEAGTGSSIAEYDFIGRDRVLQRTYPGNGTRLTTMNDAATAVVGYDGARRLIELQHKRSDHSLIVGFRNGYDRMRNKVLVEQLHNPDNTEMYGFDSAYRLISFNRFGVVGPPVPPIQSNWTLDGPGNWRQVDAETRLHTSFNEIYEITTGGGTMIPILSDDNGNQVENDVLTYAYDFRNRLVECFRKTPVGPEKICDYDYDALGRRVRKVITNSGAFDGTSEFSFDGRRIVEEEAPAGLTHYVRGGEMGEPLNLNRDLDGDGDTLGRVDELSLYHGNSLHSTYAMTDSSAAVIEGFLYEAYGAFTRYDPGPNGVIDFGMDDVLLPGSPGPSMNPYLLRSGRFDPETGLYSGPLEGLDELDDTAYIGPVQGRSLQRNAEQLGYVFSNNNPVNAGPIRGLDRADFDFGVPPRGAFPSGPPGGYGEWITGPLETEVLRGIQEGGINSRPHKTPSAGKDMPLKGKKILQNFLPDPSAGWVRSGVMVNSYLFDGASLSKPYGRGDKPREIVVVGSKVKDVVRSAGYWLPEVDDQVLVIFEHGDIDRPIITGRVYSMKPTFPLQGEPAAAVGGYDPLHRLRRGRTSKSFLQTKGGDLFDPVGGPYSDLLHLPAMDLTEPESSRFSPDDYIPTFWIRGGRDFRR